MIKKENVLNFFAVVIVCQKKSLNILGSGLYTVL